MAYEEKMKRFVAVLKGTFEGRAGNMALREELGWNEGLYDNVKSALLEKNRIIIGAGRGGSVAITAKVVAKSAQKPHPRKQTVKKAAKPATAAPPRTRASGIATKQWRMSPMKTPTSPLLDPETASADLVGTGQEAIKRLFPEAVTEGKIDFDVLKQLLGTAVEEREEKYGLNWHGKRKARQIALTPSTGTLLPCPEESVDWDTTQNLMIEGDNLEVLKLLQKSYAGKVKLIYIDPPYNTGNEFVYPDDFKDNIRNYFELTGQIDGGKKLTSNTESSGRFHTEWLSMMYPRLKLARSLLTNDGAIFVSIGEDEVGNLRKVCDEIFGEENFVATLVWDGGRKNDSKKVSVSHEYILTYVRDNSDNIADNSETTWRERKDGIDAIYQAYESGKKRYKSDWQLISKHIQDWYRSLPETNPAREHEHYRFADSNGVYFASDLSGPDDGRKNRPRYTVHHPVTGKPVPTPSRGWRWEEPRMRQEIAAGRVHFGIDETSIPNGKVYLKENEWQAPSSVFYKDRRAASGALKKLMGEKVFDFPKDTTVLARLVSMICKNGDIALDFFAGSGSLGEAVMEVSSQRQLDLRFILVQLPEALEEDSRAWAQGYKTIADIARERLRRCGTAIRNRNGLLKSDVGFRSYKLASSNILAWAPNPADIAGTLLANIEHLVRGRTEHDVLTELLLKLGLDLCVPITKKEIAGKTVYSIGGGALIVCLAGGITKDVVEPLSAGVIAWHNELSPAVDTRIVFKDSGFEDDVAKTNMAAILNQNGISDVRSL